MRVLVTGGAGYIGSVVTEELLARGDVVVVLDNLSTGHRASLHPDATFVECDTRDTASVARVLRQERIEAVVHMAAQSLVGVSVTEPRGYFDNNVRGGLSLLDAMLEVGVGRIVFSSTAAVFGEPDRTPIAEDAPTRPTNPYGDTKLMLEMVLRRYDEAYGLRFGALRYFNAAGASARCGEDHRPETHLIPRILAAARDGGTVQVYGDDYATPDGTCVRDYIHVIDLARAHLLALDAIGERSRVYNLGCGGGYSVLEVIESARRVTGRALPAQVSPRRPGDPAVLVASSERIRQELGWAPQHADLDAIIGSAWEWMGRHPGGWED